MAIPICPSDLTVELSSDGTTWDDVSAFIGRVDPQSRDMPRLVYKTFAGPVYCTGVADPTDVEIEILVTEDDADAYTVLRAAHFAGTAVGLRWKPTGGTKAWTAASGMLTSWDDPELNASEDTTLPIALATLTVDQVGWALAA